MLFYAFLCATSIALALFASAVWFGMRKESSGHENLWLGIFSLSFAMRICYPFLRAYGIPLTESLYALEDFMAAAGLLCISRIISSLCLRKNSAAERLLLGVHIGFLVLCGTLPLFVLRLIPGFIPVYGNLIYFFKAADALILLALLFRYCIRGDRKENLLLIAGMSCYASALGMHAFFLGQFEPARFGWFDKWAGYVMILLFSVRMILQNFRVIRENYRLKYHLEEEVDRKTKILKELLEERRMLLSAFAHDMKTPITSINNFTRLVEIDNDDLDEESRHYLDTIRKKTVEMQENLNMIHEFSRHDTPLTVLEPVDLIRLTTEFYEKILRISRLSGFVLNCSCPTRLVSS